MNVIGKEYYWNNSTTDLDFVSYVGSSHNWNVREVIKGVVHPWFHKRKNDLSEESRLIFSSEKVAEHLPECAYKAADQTVLVDPQGMLSYLWYGSAVEFTRNDKIKTNVDRNIKNIKTNSKNIIDLDINVFSLRKVVQGINNKTTDHAKAINKANSRINALETAVKSMSNKINEIISTIQQIQIGGTYNVPSQHSYTNPPDEANVSETPTSIPALIPMDNTWEDDISMEWPDIGLVDV